MISSQAPAKVILSGEHAVVYGKPALVSAIDKKLTFSLSQAKKIKDQSLDFIAQIVKKFLIKKQVKFFDKPYSFKIQSEIPLGRGLGSSAALSVAAVTAFLKFYSGKKFEKEEINNLAYEAEKKFHQNPSGVDNTISCFGGLIFYRKEFEFLKNISLLNFKIPKKIEENLFLIDSGRPAESTREMVEWVKEKYNKKQTLVDELLARIEKTTKKMTVSLIKEDVELFSQMMIENEIYLEILGVVSKKTKKLLEKLQSFGVGKITGAGGRKEGSGFILFFSFEKKGLIEFLEKNRIDFFSFKQNFEGVKFLKEI